MATMLITVDKKTRESTKRFIDVMKERCNTYVNAANAVYGGIFDDKEKELAFEQCLGHILIDGDLPNPMYYLSHRYSPPSYIHVMRTKTEGYHCSCVHCENERSVMG